MVKYFLFILSASIVSANARAYECGSIIDKEVKLRHFGTSLKDTTVNIDNLNVSSQEVRAKYNNLYHGYYDGQSERKNKIGQAEYARELGLLRSPFRESGLSSDSGMFLVYNNVDFDEILHIGDEDNNKVKVYLSGGKVTAVVSDFNGPQTSRLFLLDDQCKIKEIYSLGFKDTLQKTNGMPVLSFGKGSKISVQRLCKADAAVCSAYRKDFKKLEVSKRIKTSPIQTAPATDAR